MAVPSRSSDCEVATCMNEARRINIYCDADCDALTDVTRVTRKMMSSVTIVTTKLALRSASVLIAFLSMAVTTTKVLIVILFTVLFLGCYANN